jgi:hypothetical protein
MKWRDLRFLVMLAAVTLFLAAMAFVEGCQTMQVVSLNDVLVTSNTPSGQFIPYPSNGVPVAARPPLRTFAALSFAQAFSAVTNTNGEICVTNQFSRPPGKVFCFTPCTNCPPPDPVGGFDLSLFSPAPYTTNIAGPYGVFTLTFTGTWIQSHLVGQTGSWTNHLFVPALGSNVTVYFPFAPGPGKEFKLVQAFSML